MLAFGGLDVAAGANPADRTVQIIRFGLFVVANIGIFGAALALAAPLAASIVLVLGAVAWVAASFLTRHGNELILFITPALLLIAAILSLIAWFRRPRPEEADVEIIRPLSARRDEEPGDVDDENDYELEPEVEMPAFAAEPQRRSSRRNAPEPDDFAPTGDDWDPRRKRQVPPRTRGGFREIEPDEYDDEPSFLSRLTLGASGVLSFALYAGLAGAAALIFWNMRPTGSPEPAAAAVAPPAPVLSSEEPVRVAEIPAPVAEEPERIAPGSAAMADPVVTSTQPAAEQPAVRAVGETAAPAPGANSITITPEAPPAAPAATTGATSTTEPPPALQQAPTPVPGQPAPMFMPTEMAALRQQDAPDPVDAPLPPAAAASPVQLAPLGDAGL